MADDQQANLENYRLQLQQVDAALSATPDNEDLLKLKKDLQEVIDLTVELLSSQTTSTSATLAVPIITDTTAIKWSVGDRCMAMYQDDGKHYPATVEEVDPETQAITVCYDGYDDEVGILQPSQVKLMEDGKKRPTINSAGPSAEAAKAKAKREQLVAQKEYRRKKQQKKAQRIKQLEEDKEEEKNKWKSFNAKVFSKTTKGKVKKSIFASPDNPVGKVGVGTCGVSGRPMTAYHQNEKWKKGQL